MSYDNTKYWFDEFNPTEAMCLALIDKGMKWHKKDKLFEDCYGVYWSEEIVFAIIDKLVHQTVLEEARKTVTKGVLKDLAFRRESLLESVTRLSLEGFDEYIEKISWVVSE
ncbi:MAG: hypothetical protein J6W35_07910 [Eubacterium sp.]|nr:hypothetical protein [Eubacterium sp.]